MNRRGFLKAFIGGAALAVAAPALPRVRPAVLSPATTERLEQAIIDSLYRGIAFPASPLVVFHLTTARGPDRIVFETTPEMWDIAGGRARMRGGLEWRAEEALTVVDIGVEVPGVATWSGLLDLRRYALVRDDTMHLSSVDVGFEAT